MTTDDDAAFRAALGARLRSLRVRAGMSLRQVEAATGGSVPFETLGCYERGERMPSIRRVARLATFYRLSLDELVRDLDDVDGGES